MKLKAFGEYVLVHSLHQPTSPGGVHLPDSARAENPGRGRVAAVDFDWEGEPLLTVGDVVHFDTYGVYVLPDGVLAVKYDSIVAVEG